MSTATSKKTKTPTSLAERINLAKRRLAFLERLAESKCDVAAGRADELKMRIEKTNHFFIIPLNYESRS